MRVQVVHSGNAWILRRLARYLVDGCRTSLARLAPVRDSRVRPDLLRELSAVPAPAAPLRRALLWRKPRSRCVGAFFPHREGTDFDEVAR